MAARDMSCTLHSVIRGHHVYKIVWTPYIDEGLCLEVEDGNEKVRHAVAIVKNGMIVGHMPRVLAICNHRSVEKWKAAV